MGVIRQGSLETGAANETARVKLLALADEVIE
jgi:hypothetical protein